ncbi:hypothetical protein [Prosthecobacter sp.]|uniref:hypothetical protein n=1 Tax=Prosthecobacter sp. TaxID=1965333 RepID=UPI003783BB0F
MPKLDSAPITKDDLLLYLNTADDFQFEIDVFRSCMEKDRTAEHGGTYQDPLTGKDRQFDIRMKFTQGSSILRLAVECKNLKKHYPLLVSRIPRRREEAYHHAVRTGKENCWSYRFPPAHTMYRKNELVGKSTTQVGKTATKDKELTASDSEVFDKWSQALASSFDLVSDAGTSLNEFENTCLTTVIIPVLVVSDGTLWAIDYSANGQIADEPKQVDECTIFVGKKYAFGKTHSFMEHQISHLHVYTKKGFDAFLEHIRSDDSWEDVFPLHTIT